jgi:hypothetical protein
VTDDDDDDDDGGCSRHRPWDELISHPRSPAICVSGINVGMRTGPYVNRCNIGK